ncbi:hypothetical protein OIK40_09165 [Erythrobacter sp. sf7]|uniref:Lipoprotein n=1 Tax=Erythrobacter fulvus TaxID=2987523 RepID=A0ABT5JPU7_9SPHN|nr:hypothetical protein [Erythrobacter fulvus]MDC8754808.1 hypothetical protein [Erythrobacter fulvus]
MNTDRFALAIAGSVLLSGCATYGNMEGAYDPAGFGEANRQSYAAMIVNPEPVYTEDMTASGEKAADAVERYRKDEVKQPDRPSTGDTPGG